MQLSRILFRIALSLLPIAVLGTTWLYLYPIFHSCAFPVPPPSYGQRVAPFRLLALGDPQLEGDSSLPNPDALIFPSVENLIPNLRNASSTSERRDILLDAGGGIVKDLRKWLEGKRKAIDLWGNDWYLAHIVRSLRWWTQPTHISVLGDLLGSQWVTDGEFERRAGRYWNIVMRGLRNVPGHVFGVSGSQATVELTSDATEAANSVMAAGSEGDHDQIIAPEEAQSVLSDTDEEASSEEPPERQKMWGGTIEVLGANSSWAGQVINIAGNHDVGYAGDIDGFRVDRFERAFGSVNWDIWFTLPQKIGINEAESSSGNEPTLADRPALRIVVLNSMNLDTPAWDPNLQTETYEFINHIITSSRTVMDKTHATVLLTHIPLEKESGVCVDSPYFDFFEGGQGVKEQNMLSDHASKIVLEGIFGMSSNKDVAGGGQGRRGIVLNGHDHAGCDVVHYIRQPGVEDKCQADSVPRHEAYWPPKKIRTEVTPTILSEASPIETCSAPRNGRMGHVFEEEEECSKATPETLPVADHDDMTEETDSPPKWKARRFPPLPYDINGKSECTSIQHAPHMREITLRSMMGEYSGYAGFLSAWFDESLGERGEWVFEFATCGIGVQHWWWSVHIVLLSLFVTFAAGCAISVYEARSSSWLSSPDKSKGGRRQHGVTAVSSLSGDAKHLVNATTGYTYHPSSTK